MFRRSLSIADMKPVFLLAVLLAQPLVAAELEVVTAIGVVAPEGLQAGQRLSAGTRLSLEPWGRAVIRETTGCGLTHVVVGLDDHGLAQSEDCSHADEPLLLAARIQQGEAFSERVKETGSGPASELVLALTHNPCAFLSRFSEEDEGGRQCPSGYALRGLRCSGAYCDNKDLMCCPYLAGEADPSTKDIQARWISEEFPNVMMSKQFLNGLTCRGPYCDDLLPQPFKSSRLTNTKTCAWSVWTSERPGSWLDCGEGNLIGGIRCRDQYCGDVGLYCCRAKLK